MTKQPHLYDVLAFVAALATGTVLVLLVGPDPGMLAAATAAIVSLVGAWRLPRRRL